MNVEKQSQSVSLSWIALLRIMLGVLFITTWASNLKKGFYTPDGLQYFFTDVFPFELDFLRVVRH